jgi:hypothetical protein
MKKTIIRRFIFSRVQSMCNLCIHTMCNAVLWIRILWDPEPLGLVLSGSGIIFLDPTFDIEFYTFNEFSYLKVVKIVLDYIYIYLFAKASVVDPDPYHTDLKIWIWIRIRIRILLFSSSGFQDASFFAYHFLKVHLHQFSKIKCHREVIKQ